MEFESRLAEFNITVDRCFAFLSQYAYRQADTVSYCDRFESVLFDALDRPSIYISWDTYDGSLNVELDGRDVWSMLAANGLWHAGRGYQGFTVEAMRHGLDRIEEFLMARPQLLKRLGGG